MRIAVDAQGGWAERRQAQRFSQRQCRRLVPQDVIELLAAAAIPEAG